MSEATLWRYLRDGLRPLRVDMQRHEDLAAVGVPDVSYGARGVQGWIELKHMAKFTRNGVKIPWRPGQREWLQRRGAVGGRCWLLVRVEKDNFLFNYEGLPLLDTKYDRQDFELWSALHWETGEYVWSELLEALTR